VERDFSKGFIVSLDSFFNHMQIFNCFSSHLDKVLELQIVEVMRLNVLL
jgi:hypothetical protein